MLKNDKSLFTYQRSLPVNIQNQKFHISYFQTFSSKTLDFYIVSFLLYFKIDLRLPITSIYI